MPTIAIRITAAVVTVGPVSHIYLHRTRKIATARKMVVGKPSDLHRVHEELDPYGGYGDDEG